VTISSVRSSLLSEEDRARVLSAISKIESDGDLPEAVQEPFLGLLRLIAEGRGATILESGKDLTSTQAAEAIGVSRPFLNKLLDEGRIPFHKTGRDRRIAVNDVESYVRKRNELKKQRAEAALSYDERRSERIATLAGVSSKEAAELGFG
jgi:excisionase family DNA binding protein